MYKLTGGFGSYLFGMSARIAQQSTDNSTSDIKDPGLLWFIGFLFVVSFLGLFSVVPLRKVLNKLIRNLVNQLFQHSLVKITRHWFQIMIVDLKLPYPSGTVTAYLINSFHTPQGAKLAK